MTDELSNMQIGTYEILIAESILAYANVNLSPDCLRAQLENRDSFYASLVKLPALNASNSLVDAQCRDFQTYLQERLIEFILSGKEEEMTQEADLELKKTIEEQRLELIKLGDKLAEIEKRHYQLMLDTYSWQEKHAKKWAEEAEKQTENLWPAIVNCDPSVSPEKKTRLLDLLKTQAAGIVIPEKLLKTLKLTAEQLSPVEKAILQILIETGMIE